MILGIGSYTYTWAVGVPGHRPDRPLTAKDLLLKAQKLGVRVVQFADNLPLDALPPDQLSDLARRSVDMGVGVEVGTRGIQPDHLLAYLRTAEQTHSAIVRVVLDTADHKPSEDEAVDLIRTAMPDYERAGVVLAIENHDRFRARALARIVEGVDSRSVGVCLDTVNSFGALEGPEVVVDTLAPLTVNLHIKDFAIRRANHQMGFAIEGTPAGEGRLDVHWLLDKVRDNGHNPNAILELWTPPEDDLAATIAKEDTWAEQSIGYLRKMIDE